MEFNKYQEKAKETAEYPVLKHKWVYPSMGLAGESGEVVEKLKKIARNKNGMIEKEDREKLIMELGDVLWYLSILASDLGISLNEVAEKNIIKLKSRRERGVIKSHGDNR